MVFAVCMCVCAIMSLHVAQNHHHKLWRIRRSKVNAHCRLHPDFTLQFSDVWWQATAKWHQKPPLQPRHQWDVSKKLQSCIYILYTNQISHVSGSNYNYWHIWFDEHIQMLSYKESFNIWWSIHINPVFSIQPSRVYHGSCCCQSMYHEQPQT